jgi:hypothetical protein
VAPRTGLALRVSLASLPAFAILALPVPWEAHLLGSLAVFAVAIALTRAVPPDLLHALRR